MQKLKLLAAGMIIAGGLCARAEEWPQWRGPQGDGISRETGLLTTWPAEGPTKLWTVPTARGHASPIAVDGKVYLFTYDDEKGQEILQSLNADTGKEIWRQAYAGGYKSSNQDWLGTRATPVVVGDMIYTYGGSGDLVARKIADGSQVWHTNILKETKAQPLTWGEASTPLVVDDAVYVQGGKGPGAPVAVSVNRTTGKIIWQSEAKSIAGKTKGEVVAGGYAHPIMVTIGGIKQLIVFGGAALYGMEPATGKTIWTEAWLTEYDVNATVPIYLEPNLFVTSGYNHGCMMLELSAGGAKKLWETQAVQGKFNGDILDKGFLYVVGDEKGSIKCLTWPDGKMKWETKTSDARVGAGGSIVRVGDLLILLSERGNLTLASATPEGFKKISSVKGLVAGSNVWATPLIYHGKLYVKGVEELVCLDISGK